MRICTYNAPERASSHIAASCGVGCVGRSTPNVSEFNFFSKRFLNRALHDPRLLDLLLVRRGVSSMQKHYDGFLYEWLNRDDGGMGPRNGIVVWASVCILFRLGNADAYLIWTGAFSDNSQSRMRIIGVTILTRVESTTNHDHNALPAACNLLNLVVDTVCSPHPITISTSDNHDNMPLKRKAATKSASSSAAPANTTASTTAKAPRATRGKGKAKAKVQDGDAASEDEDIKKPASKRAKTSKTVDEEEEKVKDQPNMVSYDNS